MRFFATIITAMFLLPLAASAAPTAEQLAAIDAACREKLGITDASLVRQGAVKRNLSRCIDIEKRTLQNEDRLDQLQRDREELVTKTTEKFRQRYRGKDPSTVTRTQGTRAAVSRTTKNRVSPRTMRSNAYSRGSTTGTPLKSE